MKQFKFNTDASHYTYTDKWDHQQGAWLTQSVKRHEALNGTQTGRDDLLFTSMICSLFHSLWLESFLCLWPNYYADKWWAYFLLFQNKCSHHTRSLQQKGVSLLSTHGATTNLKWKFLWGTLWVTSHMKSCLFCHGGWNSDRESTSLMLSVNLLEPCHMGKITLTKS